MALPQRNPVTSPFDEPQWRAVQSLLEDLSPAQMAWVSGYLAGLARVEPAPAAEPPAAEPITILYGSQTGNAKSVAERLGARALEQGLAASVLGMGDFHPRKLAKERWVLLVVSTHGEGEPPENAHALHRFVHDAQAPRLERLRYAVLALGDSSYEHFCRTGQEFDQRLADLGAQRLMPLQCCDLDFQAEAKRWSDGALERLSELTTRRASNVVALPGLYRPAPRAHDRDNPFAATLLENRRITTADAIADVRHLALEIDPRAVRFQPGDALGVWFRNDPNLVAVLLDQLGLDGDSPVRLDDEESSLHQALSERLELTRLHPKTLSGWAPRASGPDLAELAADGARVRDWIATRQFIDLVTAYPAAIEAQDLAALLPPLTPRLYSIASSQAAFEDEVHLTVSLVRSATAGAERLGGATGFLCERLARGASVGVYVVENPGFRLPEDGSTPVILIGAGTGVAPYRAFLQQRAAHGDSGRNWLIFGNRHFRRDFLYQLDWLGHRDAGRLNRVSLAFSRDGAERRYVQHRT